MNNSKYIVNRFQVMKMIALFVATILLPLHCITLGSVGVTMSSLLNNACRGSLLYRETANKHNQENIMRPGRTLEVLVWRANQQSTGALVDE